MITLAPEQNTFDTIAVDITHRCNMACANCYLPDRTKPDMDINRMIDALARLPRRTKIRIVGAEPTMRRDLPEIISRVGALGHRVFLLTNGLRLARESYVKELRDAGLRNVYISMNGADNDDWYEHIDMLRCADKKLAALHNCASNRMLISTGTILARGVNEGAVARMIDMMTQLNLRHALLRFKNVGALGRYDQAAEHQNLTMREMEELFANHMGIEAGDLSKWCWVDGHYEQNTRLFPLHMNPDNGQGIWTKLTNWAVDDAGRVDAGSQRRGRLTETFEVAPFFEDIIRREGAHDS